MWFGVLPLLVGTLNRNQFLSNSLEVDILQNMSLPNQLQSTQLLLAFVFLALKRTVTYGVVIIFVRDDF